MRLDYKIIAVESTKNDLVLLSLQKTFEERRVWNPDVYRGHSKHSLFIVILACVSFIIIKHLAVVCVTS